MRASIRPMHWSDIPAVVALEASLHPDDPWTEGTWWAEIAARPRRDYQVLVGPDAQLWGYAGLDVSGDVADVMTISIAPGHQGKGLGRELLTHLHTRAIDVGAARVMLEVRADNGPAIALYERADYRHLHTRRGYYQGGRVDAWVMQKSLDSVPTANPQEI